MVGQAESPAITVVFATHNGEQTLPRTLRAMSELAPPRRPWRILAVDNASTDNTAEVLRSFAGSLPLTVIDCPKPGKSSALRRAVPEIAGDLVVMTDDDVLPCPQWLCAYEDAADAHPDVDLFGGPIAPATLGDAGPWFEASAAHHRELFAKCETRDGPLDPVDGIFGGNFMMRARHLGALLETPEHIGPRFEAAWRDRYPMGEDARIMMALAARGVSARGVQAAHVRHLVRPAQTDLSFLLGRAVRHGRGMALIRVGEGRFAWARRLKLITRYALHGFAKPEPAAVPGPEVFEAMWRAHWFKGHLLGAAFGPFSRP